MRLRPGPTALVLLPGAVSAGRAWTPARTTVPHRHLPSRRSRPRPTGWPTRRSTSTAAVPASAYIHIGLAWAEAVFRLPGADRAPCSTRPSGWPPRTRTNDLRGRVDEVHSPGPGPPGEVRRVRGRGRRTSQDPRADLLRPDRSFAVLVNAACALACARRPRGALELAERARRPRPRPSLRCTPLRSRPAHTCWPGWVATTRQPSACASVYVLRPSGSTHPVMVRHCGAATAGCWSPWREDGSPRRRAGSGAGPGRTTRRRAGLDARPRPSRSPARWQGIRSERRRQLPQPRRWSPSARPISRGHSSHGWPGCKRLIAARRGQTRRVWPGGGSSRRPRDGRRILASVADSTAVRDTWGRLVDLGLPAGRRPRRTLSASSTGWRGYSRVIFIPSLSTTGGA